MIKKNLSLKDSTFYGNVAREVREHNLVLPPAVLASILEMADNDIAAILGLVLSKAPGDFPELGEMTGSLVGSDFVFGSYADDPYALFQYVMAYALGAARHPGHLKGMCDCTDCRKELDAASAFNAKRSRELHEKGGDEEVGEPCN